MPSNESTRSSRLQTGRGLNVTLFAGAHDEGPSLWTQLNDTTGGSEHVWAGPGPEGNQTVVVGPGPAAEAARSEHGFVAASNIGPLELCILLGEEAAEFRELYKHTRESERFMWRVPDALAQRLGTSSDETVGAERERWLEELAALRRSQLEQDSELFSPRSLERAHKRIGGDRWRRGWARFFDELVVLARAAVEHGWAIFLYGTV